MDEAKTIQLINIIRKVDPGLNTINKCIKDIKTIRILEN